MHNDGSCAICTKNNRNVEAFCAKQKKLQFCNTCYKKVTKRLQNGYRHRKAPSAPPARLAYGSPYILYQILFVLSNIFFFGFRLYESKFTNTSIIYIHNYCLVNGIKYSNFIFMRAAARHSGKA